MTRTISLQSRISDVNFYRLNVYPANYDDNFSIRLSRALAVYQVLDLTIIKREVGKIKTSFFKINKVNREKYAEILYADLEACELLVAPGEPSEPTPGNDTIHIMTIKEAAAILKIGQAQTRRLCESGKLRAVKIGRQWRIDTKDIVRLFRSDEDER